jgi:hypothetical protein
MIIIDIQLISGLHNLTFKLHMDSCPLLFLHQFLLAKFRYVQIVGFMSFLLSLYPFDVVFVFLKLSSNLKWRSSNVNNIPFFCYLLVQLIVECQRVGKNQGVQKLLEKKLFSLIMCKYYILILDVHFWRFVSLSSQVKKMEQCYFSPKSYGCILVIYPWILPSMNHGSSIKFVKNIKILKGALN